MSFTFVHLLREIDEKYGDLIAYRRKDQEEILDTTYHTFVSDVKSLSGWLRANNYQGKHVGLIGKNSYEWLIWFFAVIVSGGIAIPINKFFAADMVMEIVKQFDIEVLLYDPEENDLSKEDGFHKLVLKNMKVLVKSDVPYPEAEAVKPDTLACILLTSGTTGTSKGVMLSQRNLLTPYHKEGPAGSVNVLTILPLHHISGIYDIVQNLIRGNCIAICDSAKHFLKDIKLFQPDHMFLVPGFIKLLIDMLDASQGKILTGNLNEITSCGAPLQPSYQDSLNRYGINLRQAYGLTETAGEVTLCSENLRYGGIGKVCGWNELAFDNGEIKIKGDNVMLGYYKNPTATKEVLAEGWFYTGDTGYMDEMGFVHINGRKKNLIILSNGENISPEELELMLVKCILIQEVIVKADDDRICAEIYTADSKKLLKTDIQQQINGYIRDMNLELPPFKQIRKIIYRDCEFEKTAVGKIMR